jgi:hypothetical protein
MSESATNIFSMCYTIYGCCSFEFDTCGLVQTFSLACFPIVPWESGPDCIFIGFLQAHSHLCKQVQKTWKESV